MKAIFSLNATVVNKVSFYTCLQGVALRTLQTVADTTLELFVFRFSNLIAEVSSILSIYKGQISVFIGQVKIFIS